MTDVLTDSAAWDECPHGLTMASCSLCRHPYVPPPKPTVEFTTKARFEGRCAECNLPIFIGQVIVRMSDERWVHSDCVDK